MKRSLFNYLYKIPNTSLFPDSELSYIMKYTYIQLFYTREDSNGFQVLESYTVRSEPQYLFMCLCVWLLLTPYTARLRSFVSQNEWERRRDKDGKIKATIRKILNWKKVTESINKKLTQFFLRT